MSCPPKSSLVGTSTDFVSPVPSCPLLLYPHTYTSPYLFSTTVCFDPALIFTTSVSPFISLAFL